MTPILDVATVQQALDALVTGDRVVAERQFTDDLVLTGTGGCLNGHATGLEAVLGRFTDLGHLTGGTFGTEVETVYLGTSDQLVVVTRHWASIGGNPVHGTQALLVTIVGRRIRVVDALSPLGPASGIWD